MFSINHYQPSLITINDEDNENNNDEDQPGNHKGESGSDLEVFCKNPVVTWKPGRSLVSLQLRNSVPCMPQRRGTAQGLCCEFLVFYCSFGMVWDGSAHMTMDLNMGTTYGMSRSVDD